MLSNHLERSASVLSTVNLSLCCWLKNVLTTKNWIENFFCSYRVHCKNQWVVNRLTKCANSLLIWENKLPWPKPLTPFLWYVISDIQRLVETRSDKVLKLFLATAEKTWSVKKLSINILTKSGYMKFLVNLIVLNSLLSPPNGFSFPLFIAYFQSR